MTDFANSVAQQQVEIATEVSTQSTVGENFWGVLYLTAANVGVNLVTKSSYESVIDALTGLSDVQCEFMKLNLASLFEYGSSVKAYIVGASDYKRAKLKGYFTYVEPAYAITSGVAELGGTMQTIFGSVTVDSEFTKLVTDVAVSTTLATAEAVTDELKLPFTQLLTALNTAGDVWTFARGAEQSDEGFDFPADGASPALYQIGRTLAYLNAAGTSVGNSLDMVASNRYNVLPTLDMSTDTVVACEPAVVALFEDNNVQYFRPVGNNTGSLASVGAKTLRGNYVGADWFTAYQNFITRVDCAEIITVMNTFTNAKTYNSCILAMQQNLTPYSENLGRIENLKITAPDWTTAKQLGGGDTIVIPEAWEAYYVDNARRVKISGTLYISA